MISSVWSSRLLEGLEKSLVFGRQSGVIGTEYEGEIRNEGDRVHIHSFNDLTIGTYTRNTTTISYELLTDARQTLLIDQSKFFAFKVDDLDAAQMKPKVVDAATGRASYQLAETADRYLAGLHSGITNFTATSQATSANIYQKLVETKVKLASSTFPKEGASSSCPPGSRARLAEQHLPRRQRGVGPQRRHRPRRRVQRAGLQQRPDHGHGPGRVPPGGRPRQRLDIRAADSRRRGHQARGSFADGIRGLHLYGAKVIAPDRLHVLRVNP
jgi:hypothetical protein